MMNATLSLADWHKFGVEGGMYGFFLNDTSQSENPLLTTVRPRVVTLNPGQVIFRWIHSGNGGTWQQKAAGPWWSTKRGAHEIIGNAGGGDTSDHARAFSNVARSWGSDMAEVVCATVRAPIRCFLGVGRAIYDKQNKEAWTSKGHQLFIPNMGVKDASGRYTLSPDAVKSLRIDWVKASHLVDEQEWSDARARAAAP